jgi:threonine dehydrogenase-like Zn-dependent dehydrogenase
MDMLAAVFNEPRSITVEERRDPVIAEPTDAIVCVVLACVCGSDLWSDVVGDGAVGLSGVLAARRIGADRIIALSRNPVRQDRAREFGATDIVEQRGDEASEAVMALAARVGVDAALECVGTGQAMQTALAIARSGSRFDPGRVFDFETDLNGVGEAYAAMDERRAIKSLLRVGSL